MGLLVSHQRAVAGGIDVRNVGAHHFIHDNRALFHGQTAAVQERRRRPDADHQHDQIRADPAAAGQYAIRPFRTGDLA